MSFLEKKIAKITSLIAGVFIALALRIIFLVVAHGEKYEKIARNPRFKTIHIEPFRGTIRDRFNQVLATNKIDYSLGILYEEISSIPRIRWIKEEGRRKKIFPRSSYIKNLSKFLSSHCPQNQQEIEDMIYSKAALFPSTFFPLKSQMSEKEYYQMRFLEKDWPGLKTHISPKRFYPKGKLACHVLGHLGKMNFEEYLNKKAEIVTLSRYLDESLQMMTGALPKGYTSQADIAKRLAELQSQIKGMNLLLGKKGVEKTFDHHLAGQFGVEKYEIDHAGIIIRKLPDSKPPVSGRRVMLTLSSQLQEHAEKLLMESEKKREKEFLRSSKGHQWIQEPWIKGGAIVAMDPKHGDVLAFASYPRFDPNDFIEKDALQKRIRWLETPKYIEDLWDGKEYFYKEWEYLHLDEEKKKLTLEEFFRHIVSPQSDVFASWQKLQSLHEVVAIQNIAQKMGQHFSSLEDAFKEFLNNPHTISRLLTKQQYELVETFFRPISHPADCLLFVDMCRLIINPQIADEIFLSSFGHLSPSTFRTLEQSVIIAREKISTLAEKVFSNTDFQKWRETFFADFLLQKRKEEKKTKTTQKPFVTYLEEAKSQLFKPFFHENQGAFLEAFLTKNAPIKSHLHNYLQHIIAASMEEKSPEIEEIKRFFAAHSREEVQSFFRCCQSFQEHNRPLVGRYFFPKKPGKAQTEKDLIHHFYPLEGYGYAKSYVHNYTAPLGSIFKIVTAYEGIKQKVEKTQQLNDINPLTVIDSSPPYHHKMDAKSVLGYTISGIPIFRHYKGGRIPRGHVNIGKVDLVRALEKSSNLYFSLLAKDHLMMPTDLSKSAVSLGFGKKTGIQLDGEKRGHVPFDLFENVSNLYSFAIGQHSLLVTPLQTAVMMSTFMNDGLLTIPRIASCILNMEPREKENILFLQKFAFQEALKHIGIFFPLFTSNEASTRDPYIEMIEPVIKSYLFLPREIRMMMFEGLYRVMNSEGGTARFQAIRSLHETKSKLQSYKDIAPYCLGKTSTAEKHIKPFLNRSLPPILTKDIWFSLGSFKEVHRFDHPELVVIVYLRYGDFGKECAPIATSMVEKYRSIMKLP